MTTEDNALPCATFLQRFASPYRERPQTAVAGEGLWRLSSRRRLETFHLGQFSLTSRALRKLRANGFREKTGFTEREALLLLPFRSC